MVEPTSFKYDETENPMDNSTELTEREAFVATRRAFTELEAMGASYFNIFNAFFPVSSHQPSNLKDSTFFCPSIKY
jgi:hypothetical protein